MLDGVPVKVGSRALEVLVALVEQAGKLAEKRTLMALAWPTSVVEECNLRSQIAALRHLLDQGADVGHDRTSIVTVPGRGYRFTAPVIRVDDVSAIPGSRPRVSRSPIRLTRTVGRDQVVGEICVSLRLHRFATVAGHGGIGKTTVARAVVDAMQEACPDGVLFVDLSATNTPQLAGPALAGALGLAPGSGDPVADIVSALRDRQMLVVLDGCDHIAVEATKVINAMLSCSRKLAVMATSREALHAHGEQLHRLSTLPVPPVQVPPVSAAEALKWPAVELFVDHVRSSRHEYVLTDDDAPLIVETCRRLDGIPLALELVAGHVDAFGVRGIVDLLDDRFRMLTLGRRAALRRHRTLEAMLDWSYDALPPHEQTLLRRLSVFAGTFDIEAACAVAGDSACDTRPGRPLANLIDKSLVVSGLRGTKAWFRLLDVTRFYARSRLDQTQEAPAIASRFARYQAGLVADASGKHPFLATTDEAPACARELDNFRAALDWCYAPGGDLVLARRLTLSMTPVWLRLSLLTECGTRAAQALRTLPSNGRSGSPEAMRLHVACAGALTHLHGSGTTTVDAWNRTLSLARDLGVADYELQALWGLWVDACNTGNANEAGRLASTFSSLASRQHDDRYMPVAGCLCGIARLFAGDYPAARAHLEHAMHACGRPAGQPDDAVFHHDPKVVARCHLAQVAALDGCFDEALAHLQANVEVALTSDRTSTQCYCLCEGVCMVLLHADRLEEARPYIAMLLDCAAQNGLAFWHARASCFKAMLLANGDGDSPAGSALALDRLLDTAGATRLGALYVPALIRCAKALANVRATARARQVITAAADLTAQGGLSWCLPALHAVQMMISRTISIEEKGGDPSGLRHTAVPASAHRGKPCCGPCRQPKPS